MIDKKDFARLIKLYEESKRVAETLLPGEDHSNNIFGMYLEIGEIIMNNLGEHYSNIISTDKGIDEVLYIINNKEMPYESRAEELLK